MRFLHNLSGRLVAEPGPACRAPITRSAPPVPYRVARGPWTVDRGPGRPGSWPVARGPGALVRGPRAELADLAEPRRPPGVCMYMHTGPAARLMFASTCKPAAALVAWCLELGPPPWCRRRRAAGPRARWPGPTPTHPGAEKMAPGPGCAGFSSISHARFHVKQFSTPKGKRAPLSTKSTRVKIFAISKRN